MDHYITSLRPRAGVNVVYGDRVSDGQVRCGECPVESHAQGGCKLVAAAAHHPAAEDVSAELAAEESRSEGCDGMRA